MIGLGKRFLGEDADEGEVDVPQTTFAALWISFEIGEIFILVVRLPVFFENFFCDSNGVLIVESSSTEGERFFVSGVHSD